MVVASSYFSIIKLLRVIEGASSRFKRIIEVQENYQDSTPIKTCFLRVLKVFCYHITKYGSDKRVLKIFEIIVFV